MSPKLLVLEPSTFDIIFSFFSAREGNFFVWVLLVLILTQVGGRL